MGTPSPLLQQLKYNVVPTLLTKTSNEVIPNEVTRQVTLTGSYSVIPKMCGTSLLIAFNHRLMLPQIFDGDQPVTDRKILQVILTSPAYQLFFVSYPSLILLGLWISVADGRAHKYITYSLPAFFITDVYDVKHQRYLPYAEYGELITRYKLRRIPETASLKNTTIAGLERATHTRDQFLKHGTSGYHTRFIVRDYSKTPPWQFEYYTPVIPIQQSYSKQSYSKTHNKQSYSKQSYSKQSCSTITAEQKYVQECLGDGGIIDMAREDILQLFGAVIWESRFIPQFLEIVFEKLITRTLYVYSTQHRNVTLNLNRVRFEAIKYVKKTHPWLFNKEIKNEKTI